jgi:hypothetical protein
MQYYSLEKWRLGGMLDCYTDRTGSAVEGRQVDPLTFHLLGRYWLIRPPAQLGIPRLVGLRGGTTSKISKAQELPNPNTPACHTCQRHPATFFAAAAAAGTCIPSASSFLLFLLVTLFFALLPSLV